MYRSHFVGRYSVEKYYKKLSKEKENNNINNE